VPANGKAKTGVNPVNSQKEGSSIQGGSSLKAGDSRKGGNLGNTGGLLNTGIIAPPRPVGTRPRRDAGKRTFIVTGIARSGTTLVAGLLKDAGVFMGQFLHDVVEEDAAMLEALHSRDMTMLRTLIGERNAGHAQWGFKLPNLHAYLEHQELAGFRNPRLVVIFRDPVAVAVRNALSEHYPEMQALIAATNAAYSLARFVERVPCPVLLLSYEKALAFPGVLIDNLLAFCELRPDDATRNRMFLRVQPNRAEYLVAARRRFVGAIDGVLDGQLYGWCAQEGRVEPVRLELHVADRVVATFSADHFRQDLAQIGVGNGSHGFYVDLEALGLAPETVISVKVAGRMLELQNSGRTLGTLPVLASG
jgi:hypothetical protein